MHVIRDRTELHGQRYVCAQSKSSQIAFSSWLAPSSVNNLCPLKMFVNYSIMREYIIAMYLPGSASNNSLTGFKKDWGYNCDCWCFALYCFSVVLCIDRPLLGYCVAGSEFNILLVFIFHVFLFNHRIPHSFSLSMFIFNFAAQWIFYYYSKSEISWRNIFCLFPRSLTMKIYVQITRLTEKSISLLCFSS